MRRFALIACLAFAIGVAAPPARADHRSGSVIAPVAHPTVARELFNRGIQSNVVGVVFPIAPSSKGKTYTLTRTSGIGNLDAYFYADDGGRIGAICSPIPAFEDKGFDDEVESGPICPGPETPGWVVIVLRTGLNAGFTFHVE